MKRFVSKKSSCETSFLLFSISRRQQECACHLGWTDRRPFFACAGRTQPKNTHTHTVTHLRTRRRVNKKTKKTRRWGPPSGPEITAPHPTVQVAGAIAGGVSNGWLVRTLKPKIGLRQYYGPTTKNSFQFQTSSAFPLRLLISFGVKSIIPLWLNYSGLIFSSQTLETGTLSLGLLKLFIV